MAKKLKTKIDYFEGYQLIGMVSQLKDYTIAYMLNETLEFDFKKYEDLEIIDTNEKVNNFSWYFSNNDILSAKTFLISNNHGSAKLIPDKKEMDYFLIFKDFPSDISISNMVTDIRKISNILAVYDFDLDDIKNADILIENIEIHEIKHILRPKKLSKIGFNKSEDENQELNVINL